MLGGVAFVVALMLVGTSPEPTPPVQVPSAEATEAESPSESEAAAGGVVEGSAAAEFDEMVASPDSPRPQTLPVEQASMSPAEFETELRSARQRTARASEEAKAHSPPSLAKLRSQSRNRIVGGSIMLGMAAPVGFMTLFAWVVADNPGLTAAAVVLSVTETCLVFCGVGLLASGLSLRGDANRASARLTPMLTPTHYGVGLIGRF